jgi:hypothetical protein
VSDINNPIVIDAQQAWTRLQNHERRSWDDWIAVSRALELGRAAALRAAQTNEPVGTKYNRAMGAWLLEHGLGGINAQTRYRALLVLENLEPITRWRDGLDPKRKVRFNHPGAVWHGWQRSMRPKREAPELPPLKLIGKPDAAQLRKLAAALRETYASRDFYLMAAAAWTAIADLTTSPQSPKMKARMTPAQPVPALA